MLETESTRIYFDLSKVTDWKSTLCSLIPISPQSDVPSAQCSLNPMLLRSDVSSPEQV